MNAARDFPGTGHNVYSGITYINEAKKEAEEVPSDCLCFFYWFRITCNR